MKSSIRVYNLNTQNDVIKIRKIISKYEGIIACEINVNKKEILLVYDKMSVSIEELINNLEISGYMVI